MDHAQRASGLCKEPVFHPVRADGGQSTATPHTTTRLADTSVGGSGESLELDSGTCAGPEWGVTPGDTRVLGKVYKIRYKILLRSSTFMPRITEQESILGAVTLPSCVASF